jgi:NAD(P)-dependent dehydrogenase (short-subunit alcohol dehydrogenase family)
MRTYLVIGGSSGIGNSIVKKLADQGHKVIATHRGETPGGSTQVEWRRYDVLDAYTDLGPLGEPLDGMVYCPGSIQLKPFSRFSPEDFLLDYRLQVTGAVSVLQQAWPLLKKGEAPGVVLLSTVAVGMGFPYHSLVSSSKGAVEGLSRALAAEWAPHVRVNCIAPALTDTRLAAPLLNTPEKVEASAQRHPLKRIGKPEDIASLACFLLGPEASWITGQVMHVDGGMSTLKT